MMVCVRPATDEEEEERSPLPEGEAAGQQTVGQHASDDDSDVHEQLVGGRGGEGVSEGSAVGAMVAPGICWRRTSSSC